MTDFFDIELDRILNDVKRRKDAAERGKAGETKLTFKEEFEAFRDASLAPVLKRISERLSTRGIQNAVVTEKQEGNQGTSEPFILLQIVHDPIERLQRAHIATSPYFEIRCDSQRERVALNRTTVGPNKFNVVVADGDARLSELNDEFVQRKVLALIQEFSAQF